MKKILTSMVAGTLFISGTLFAQEENIELTDLDIIQEVLSMNGLDKLGLDSILVDDELHLANLNLSTGGLPPSIGDLQNVTMINLDGTQLDSLPAEIWNPNFKKILLDNNPLKELPPGIENAIKLKQLTLESTKITSLPGEIWQLENLEKLSLEKLYSLKELPPGIENAPSLMQLKISKSGLNPLAPEIFQAPNLARLYAVDLGLTEVPASFCGATKLEQLDFSQNNFTSLPDCMCEMQDLEQLYLERNRLNGLPNCLADLDNMLLPETEADGELTYYLEVAGNRICDVPDDLESWVSTYAQPGWNGAAQYCPVNVNPDGTVAGAFSMKIDNFGNLVIVLTDNTGQARISVYDAGGRIVVTAEFQNRFSWGTQGLAAGTYIVEVETGNQKFQNAFSLVR